VPRITIRTKLAAALAVPLLALFLWTTNAVVDRAQEVDELQAQADLARVAVGPGGLISQLQDERTWVVVDLANAFSLGINVPTEGYDETRAATDRALTTFRAQIAAADPSVRAAYADAMAGMSDLAKIREEVDAARAEIEATGDFMNTDFTEQMYQRYSALNRPFFDATDIVVQSIDDATVRRGVHLVNLASRAIQQYSEISRHTLISGLGEDAGVNSREDIRVSTERKTLWDSYNAQLQEAPPPYDAIVAEVYPADVVESFTQLAERSLDGERIPLEELVEPMVITDWGGLKAFREALSSEATMRADRLVDEAARNQRIFLAVAVSTFLLAAALTWFVARSITRPLRSLTQQAKHMATDRLPESVMSVLRTPLGEDVQVPRVDPVTVATHDEVLEVADALNTVQDTALDLAVEQALLRRNVADSFINLGRRNQALLMRQLDLITRLEGDETDADSLANLFRLDHLATRMRRNAESLLVLAGVEPPRQWTRPVNVNDVLRAALSEVEDFQRVALREVGPATVLGSAAADLAHLLAELIENALTFSAPETLVDIRGRRMPGGAYSLAVIDRGIGMDGPSLEEANRRLAGQESFTVAPSKYLGHYVAGHLAARHGAAVRLVPNSETRGVVAIVDLPPELLAPVEPVPIRSAQAPSPAAPEQPLAAGRRAAYQLHPGHRRGAYGTGEAGGAYGATSNGNGAYGAGGNGAYGAPDPNGAYGALDPSDTYGAADPNGAYGAAEPSGAYGAGGNGVYGPTAPAADPLDPGRPPSPPRTAPPAPGRRGPARL
jgi:signal transduction histidine kinase